MKKISLLVFCIMLLSTITTMTAGGDDSQYEYLKLTTFAGGEFTQKTLTFESGGGLDNSLNFEILKKSNMISARFNVTAGSVYDVFPDGPSIDVGADGDLEWAFTGSGYGQFGYQSEFSTDRGEQLVFVPSSGETKEIKIKLPRNAEVLSANMTIKSTSISDSSYGSEQYIIAQERQSRLSYAESNGDGTFSDMESIGRISQYYADSGVGIADFDNDGDLDFIASTASWANAKPVYYFEKAGEGKNFKDRVTVGTVTASGNGHDIGLGDLNNDKNFDFFMHGWGQSVGRIFFGDGMGNFFTTDFNFGFLYSTGKAVEDLNEDGFLDMVVTGGPSSSSMSVYWYQNNGDGTFKNGVNLGISNSNGYGLVVEDFNGDDNVDILTGSTDGKWYITPGKGDGTFDPVTQYTGLDVGSYHPGYGDASDFNFDGKMDLICSSDYNSGKIKFYEGNGDGTFRLPVEVGSAGAQVAGIAAPPTTSIGSPVNMTLDIGDDGVQDWSFTGVFSGETTLTDLADDFNNIMDELNESHTYKDAYGNRMYDIPLKIAGDSPGNVVLKNLQIRYKVTTPVELNPHNGDLAHEMNELISFYESEYDLNVTIPLLVISGSSGKLIFSDVEFDYRAPNRRPQLLTLPKHLFKIDEDSGRHKNLLDMNLYVDDDRWPGGSGGLRYELVYNSEPDGLTPIIHSHYMDVLPHKDFHGRVELQLKVIDDGNDAIPFTDDDFWSLSNHFNVTVLPRNDAPVVLNINGVDPHVEYLQFNATEDERLNISIEAADLDNDGIFPLKYSWEFQDGFANDVRNRMDLEISSDFYVNESGAMVYINHLSYIPDQYEVNLGSIYVFLRVTDNNGSNPLTDIVQFVIRVLNVNDEPRIKPISDYNIDEDSTLRFYVYAEDVDGDILTFSTNRTDDVGTDDLENFMLNSYTGLITFTPRNKDVGLVGVTVFVDDGSGENNSMVSRTFQILVNNTNDEPQINMITFTTIDLDPKTREIENFDYNFSTKAPQDDDLIYGDKISYQWDFDISNGYSVESREQNPSYTFPQEGLYTITLRVLDSKGAYNETIIRLRVFETDVIKQDDTDPTNRTPIEELFASSQVYYMILIIIVVGLIAAAAVSVVIRKRKIKDKEEGEVTPFKDKDLKVVLPEDLARDLATIIRKEKGIYQPPEQLKAPVAAKTVIEHSACSSPAECRQPSADELNVSLPAAASGPPRETAPAALPPAPAAAEDLPVAEPAVVPAAEPAPKRAEKSEEAKPDKEE